VRGSDSNGVVGRVTQLTTVGGVNSAVVRIGNRTVTVPVSSLTMDGRFAVSSQTRQQLRASATTTIHH
jgi:hypothetical protein